jgi:hypothetical protein
MGKAAASFIDVKKDVLRSERVEDHASFGVEDPSDAERQGGGQRITIKDAPGLVLVDVIVGKKVEDKEGFRYVRLPDQQARLRLEARGRHLDQLHRLDREGPAQDRVRTRSPSFVSDPYKVDEAVGKVTNRDPLLMKRARPQQPRRQEGQVGHRRGRVGIDGKELDAVQDPPGHQRVDRLQIVGVRPRPEQLTLQALQSKGFFVTPDGRRCSATRARSRPSATTASSTPSTSARSRSTRAWPSRPARPTRRRRTPSPRRARRRRTPTASCSSTSPTTRARQPADPPVRRPTSPRAPSEPSSCKARFDKWFYVISDASFKQIHKTRPSSSRTPAPTADPRPRAPAPRPSPRSRSPPRSPRRRLRLPDAAAIEHRASLVHRTKLARFVSPASFGIAPATTGCHDRHGRA